MSTVSLPLDASRQLAPPAGRPTTPRPVVRFATTTGRVPAWARTVRWRREYASPGCATSSASPTRHTHVG